MGAAVAVLWGCFISEQVLLRSAAREQTRVLYEMRQLRQRQRVEPASVPAPQPPPRPVTETPAVFSPVVFSPSDRQQYNCSDVETACPSDRSPVDLRL